jgi:hypothetical protein
MHKNLDYGAVRISQGVLLNRPVVHLIQGAVEGLVGKAGYFEDIAQGSYAVAEITPGDDMVALMMRTASDDKMHEHRTNYDKIFMEYVEASEEGNYAGSLLVPTQDVFVVDFIAYLTKVVIERSWREKFSVQVFVRNSFEDVVEIGMVVQFKKNPIKKERANAKQCGAKQ